MLFGEQLVRLVIGGMGGACALRRPRFRGRETTAGGKDDTQARAVSRAAGEMHHACRHKRAAQHDRHDPRSTSYRPAAVKRSGGGKSNWGREEDFYDPLEIPLGEPFRDSPANTVSENVEGDNSKLRVGCTAQCPANLPLACTAVAL